MYSISDYQQDWPRRFERIASYLSKYLNSSYTIHHVGSTAIPNMPGKDIIDISVEYACESDTHELKKHLLFRNYLRDNPNRAQWLADMKRLVASESLNKNEYIEKKSHYYSIITEESFSAAESGQKI